MKKFKAPPLTLEDFKKHYYDLKSGYKSAIQLKKEYPQQTLSHLQNLVSKQYAEQVLQEVKRPKEYNTIISPSIKNNYQIDIIIYDRYEFHQYKYILVVIDVYSRYVDAIALTNMREETLLDAIKVIFNRMGLPKNLNADNQFNIKLLNDYFQKNGIQTFFNQPDEINKNAIVERFNRTLVKLIQKVRLSIKQYDWNKYLPELIFNYNHTIHSTTGETPYDIFKNGKLNLQTIKYLHSSLKVGDNVRIKLKKQVFDKGDELKYSSDIYNIVEKVKNKFKLKNLTSNHILQTLYKDYELKKLDDISYGDQGPPINPSLLEIEKIKQNRGLWGMYPPELLEMKEKKKIEKKSKKEGLTDYLSVNEKVIGKRTLKTKKVFDI